ncbi:hypothetical protein E4T45_12311, partial [Aureobasidium sp. EXF-8846]
MLDTLKELRSVMTLSAEAAILTRASPALLHLFPALLETRSRPSSSWVTQETSPVVPTLSVPQRTLDSTPDPQASLALRTQAESSLTATLLTRTAQTETTLRPIRVMVKSTDRLLSSLSTASLP